VDTQILVNSGILVCYSIQHAVGCYRKEPVKYTLTLNKLTRAVALIKNCAPVLAPLTTQSRHSGSAVGPFGQKGNTRARPHLHCNIYVAREASIDQFAPRY
jgi:hypothetical protein